MWIDPRLSPHGERGRGGAATIGVGQRGGLDGVKMNSDPRIVWGDRFGDRSSG